MGANLKMAAMAGSGSISEISILLRPFCWYTQIIYFARKKESTAMAILPTFFFNWWGKRMRAKGF